MGMLNFAQIIQTSLELFPLLLKEFSSVKTYWKVPVWIRLIVGIRSSWIMIIPSMLGGITPHTRQPTRATRLFEAARSLWYGCSGVARVWHAMNWGHEVATTKWPPLVIFIALLWGNCTWDMLKPRLFTDAQKGGDVVVINGHNHG